MQDDQITGYADDPVTNGVEEPEAKTFPWFAIDRRIRFNQKIMCMPEERMKAWLYLCTFTNNEGQLPREQEKLFEWPFIPGYTPERLLNDIEYFKANNLIDVREDGRLEMHDFLDWQPSGMPNASRQISDKKRSAAAERQARFKERHRNDNNGQGYYAKYKQPKNNAQDNDTDNDSGNADERNRDNAGVTPIREEIRLDREEIRTEQHQQQQHPKLSSKSFSPGPVKLNSEWKECWDWTLKQWPDGCAGLPHEGLATFAELLGLPEPLPDGTNTLQAGIPDTSYFWNVVAIQLEAAKDSRQWNWANGEKRIPDVARWFRERQWTKKYEPSAEKKSAARASARYSSSHQSSIPAGHVQRVANSSRRRAV